MAERFVLQAEGWRRLGVSKTTAWRRARDDPDFPRPVVISAAGMRKAYLESEIDHYIASRAAERDATMQESGNYHNKALLLEESGKPHTSRGIPDDRRT